MGLEPKSIDEMRELLQALREAGVLSYSYRDLVVTLHPQATAPTEREEAESRKEREVEEQLSPLGLTRAEHLDLFNEVVEPIK